MPVNYNYTGRIDIDPSCLTANLKVDSGVYMADLKWAIDEYDIPKTSELIVTFNGVFERHIESLGLVAGGIGEKSIDISSLRRPLDVSLSLKVVVKDAANLPILKAFLDKKRPTIEGVEASSESILESLYDPDLEVPWAVQFDSGRPVLHISNHDEMGPALHNKPLFDLLVIPAVLEQILEWIVWDESDSKDDDVVEKWKLFFRDLDIDDDFFEKNEGMAAGAASYGLVREASASCAGLFSKRAKFLAATAKEVEDK